MKNNILMMHVLDVNKKAPFKTLFKMDEAVLKSIEEDMRKNGYDMVHPVVIWGGNMGILIDGHTRLQAATNAGLLDIPVVAKDFEDEEEALEYAIKSQRNRRNLTDGEMLVCLAELDKRRKIGRPTKTTSNEVISGKSSQNTAKLLGTSATKIEKMRTINDHGSDNIKDAVMSGDVSVNKAYNDTIKQRRQENYSEEDREDILAQLKQTRMASLKKSMVDIIINRVKRETQEFPDVSYTTEELEQLEMHWIEEIKQAKKYLCHQEEQY